MNVSFSFFLLIKIRKLQVNSIKRANIIHVEMVVINIRF